VSKEGEIVLRKYAPMGAVLPLARDYAQALGRISGNVICITDRENVVAASGVGRELENMHITKEFADFLECRENRMLSPKEYIPVTEACRGANVSEIICPIISEGDLLGCVIMLGKDSGTRFDRIDEKIVAVAANFFELQFIS
jgi:AbrB family transcriptional regulator (stage V sporulation protein T)